MTTNTIFLRDTLSKRIARGNATVSDLPLLNQLLAVQRRQCLMIGTSTGVGLVFCALVVLRFAF